MKSSLCDGCIKMQLEEASAQEVDFSILMVFTPLINLAEEIIDFRKLSIENC